MLIIKICILQEPLFAARVIYDLLFFFMVIIIVLNLIFGVIIDTFADLRSEKQKKEEILKTTCFICGKCRNTLNTELGSTRIETWQKEEMGNIFLYCLCLKSLVSAPPVLQIISYWNRRELTNSHFSRVQC